MLNIKQEPITKAYQQNSNVENFYSCGDHYFLGHKIECKMRKKTIENGFRSKFIRNKANRQIKLQRAQRNHNAFQIKRLSERKQKNENEPEKIPSPKVEDDGKTIELNLTKNGKKVTAILDTGSPISMKREHILKCTKNRQKRTT